MCQKPVSTSQGKIFQGQIFCFVWPTIQKPGKVGIFVLIRTNKNQIINLLPKSCQPVRRQSSSKIRCSTSYVKKEKKTASIVSSLLSSLSIYRSLDLLCKAVNLLIQGKGREKLLLQCENSIRELYCLAQHFFSYGRQGLHHTLQPANTVYAPWSSPVRCLCTGGMAAVTEHTHTPFYSGDVCLRARAFVHLQVSLGMQ